MSAAIAHAILVVEDDAQLRRYLAEVLEDAGYQVLLADCGSSALDVMAQARVDVVLTDLVMPGQDGVSLIAALRKQQPGLRIIAMSGRSRTDLVMDSLDMVRVLGADATLQKPFSPEDLEMTLAGVLPRQ